MNKKTAIIISGAAGLVALVFIFIKFGLREALLMMTGAPITLILGYIAVTTAIMATLVWRWRIIIKALHTEVPGYWELARYYIIAYGVSYITPGPKVGGELFRVGMLSRHCSVKKASSTVFIDKTIEMSTMGSFFIIGLAILLMRHAMPQEAAGWMIGIGVLLLTLIIAFYYQMFTGKDFIGKLFRMTRLHKTKRGMRWSQDIYDFEKYILKFYNKDKEQFVYAVIISFISWALTFLEYWIVLSILGVTGITLLKLFLVITFIGAAYMIPIPMALGTLEAGQIGVFQMIGMRGAVGVGVAIITRMKDILIATLGFIFMGYYGLRLGKELKEALPFVESKKGKRDKEQVWWNF